MPLIYSERSQDQLFVGNIDAAGVGWNGQVASTVLFAELDVRPGKLIQAEDRVHRIGQLNAAMAYYLIAKNTVEEKICKIVQQKQMNLDACIDGGIVEDEL